MKYQELMKEIRAGDTRSVYFFTGPEQYIGFMMEHTLIEKVISKGLEQLNVTTFDEKNPDITEILSNCETLPLMSDKRIVIIREETLITKTSDKNVIDTLCHYIEKPSPMTVLLIYDKIPDKRKKIYKTLKSRAGIVEYNKLGKLELEKWIGRRLNQAGKKTTQRVVSQFIMDTLYLENENKNMEIVDNELSKIIDYVGDREVITLEDVDTVMPKSIEDNIFKMVDYAMDGNKGGALKMLEQFYLEGESPFGVFGLLLRQIRMMLMVKMLSEKRMPMDVISKETKLAPFIARKVLQNSIKYPLESLKRKMIKMAELDLKMKTGKIEPEFGVEWF
ncbi:MAG: DNA polymerase III subunit delta, partial [Eubacterium sp.]